MKFEFRPPGFLQGQMRGVVRAFKHTNSTPGLHLAKWHANTMQQCIIQVRKAVHKNWECPCLGMSSWRLDEKMVAGPDDSHGSCSCCPPHYHPYHSYLQLTQYILHDGILEDALDLWVVHGLGLHGGEGRGGGHAGMCTGHE